MLEYEIAVIYCINIKNKIMENIKVLKEWVYPNGKYSHFRSTKQSIKKRFPEIFEQIKDDYATKLYMLCNDIVEIPKCLNLNCNNKVKLENIGAGFRKFCCKACIWEYQKTDIDFADKISKIHLDKKIISSRYPNLDILLYKEDKNYFIIKDYCMHGDLLIYNNIFKKLYASGINLCSKCKEEFIEKYIPLEYDIIEFKNKFEEFYNKNHFKLKEKWFKDNYPREYKIILYWSKEIKDASLSERIYLFKNGFKNRPKCKNCKENETHFLPSHLQYTLFCNSNNCKNSISGGEIELNDYIKSIYNGSVEKIYIDKSEIDIYIKEFNLAIEYNGLYYHSDEIKSDKDYHHKKWKLCKDNGIKLITVWEDEWLYKKDIIKSFIKNQLGLSAVKIGARECEIKEISSEDNINFCNENHIQGGINAAIKLGLYYNNELVSLMTFGKERSYINRKEKSKNNCYELLRFCNKKDISISGGASKLFNYFIQKYKPFKIISYSSCDISSGKLYETLGFKNVGHSETMWYRKGTKRYNRVNFMKHKIIKVESDKNKTEQEIMLGMGYTRIWGCGNLRFEKVFKS